MRDENTQKVFCSFYATALSLFSHWRSHAEHYENIKVFSVPHNDLWELCNQILFSRFYCTRFIVFRNTRLSAPLSSYKRTQLNIMQVIKLNAIQSPQWVTLLTSNLHVMVATRKLLLNGKALQRLLAQVPNETETTWNSTL